MIKVEVIELAQRIKELDYVPVGSKAVRDACDMMTCDATFCQNHLAYPNWTQYQSDLNDGIKKVIENPLVVRSRNGFIQGVSAMWLIMKMQAENVGLGDIPHLTRGVIDDVVKLFEDASLDHQQIPEMLDDLSASNREMVEQLDKIWKVIPATREQWIGVLFMHQAVKMQLNHIKTEASRHIMEELLEDVNL